MVLHHSHFCQTFRTVQVAKYNFGLSAPVVNDFCWCRKPCFKNLATTNTHHIPLYDLSLQDTRLVLCLSAAAHVRLKTNYFRLLLQKKLVFISKPSKQPQVQKRRGPLSSGLNGENIHVRRSTHVLSPECIDFQQIKYTCNKPKGTRVRGSLATCELIDGDKLIRQAKLQNDERIPRQVDG